MFERFIESLARFISSIFKKSGEFIDDTKLEYNQLKEHADVSKINTKSMLNLSVSSESTVNYFNNRTVGEFLRVIAYLVPYKYESRSNTYVAYLVRKKRKNSVEYIKFYKNDLFEDEACISYTSINKIISSNGVTTDIGNTKDDILRITDVLTKTVLDSISGDKAPMYLVHVIDEDVKIGNPKFVYECYVLMSKLISNKVERNRVNGEFQILIDKLISRAGIHLFMSYFNSLDNPMYKNYYSKSSINDLLEAVKFYNTKHFNVNKIISFSYDKNNKTKGEIVNDKVKNTSTLNIYGVTIKFTPCITNAGDYTISNLNYRFADTIIKSGDTKLVSNFTYYILSTGGLDNLSILEMRDEMYDVGESYSDLNIINLNNKVEPDIDEVMNNSNFTENKEGEFISDEFKEYIDLFVKDECLNNNTSKPNVEYISTSIPKDTVKEENVIEDLNSESKKTEDSVKLDNDENNTKDLDIIAKLGREAVDTIEDINTVDSIVKTPIINWSMDDCIKVLGSNVEFNDNITKQDVLDRISFLSKSK